jgi:hypothetical protein
LSKQQNSFANKNWTDIKVVKVVFNMIPTRTPWTIWQVWQELVLVQVTCHVSKLTMEYVVFSCTQGKIGGGTDILDLICFLNISLLCWFCVSTSSKFQLSITLGKQLHLYEVVLQNGGSKTRYGKKSYSYEAAILWNSYFQL